MHGPPGRSRMQANCLPSMQRRWGKVTHDANNYRLIGILYDGTGSPPWASRKRRRPRPELAASEVRLPASVNTAEPHSSGWEEAPRRLTGQHRRAAVPPKADIMRYRKRAACQAAHLLKADAEASEHWGSAATCRLVAGWFVLQGMRPLAWWGFLSEGLACFSLSP